MLTVVAAEGEGEATMTVVVAGEEEGEATMKVVVAAEEEEGEASMTFIVTNIVGKIIINESKFRKEIF